MISLNWVKDYIDLKGEDLKELAVKITKAGVNVEKVITNHIDNLVIGEVLECVNHPDSDHLHVCKVDIKDTILQIVCGASNVRQGIKVIVAKVGCILPGNFEIKKSNIRGIDSEGMICALFELGLEEKNETNYSKGIFELDSNAPIGEDPLAYLDLDDTLYELDVHKHRNNDCYYHIGFAYEIASILNKKVTLPTSSYNEIEDSIKNHFNLKVETNKCPYYLAKMVTNIEIKESPEFIQKRLISAGMRPINNVVDISNYVMLEYGQPMHFFDKDLLGNNILVRMANDNESITTLDNKTRILNNNDIVITDGTKPVCIAGVMGGLNTEVNTNTKTILIESAIFDAISIRNTSSRLNLKSEASLRYGKGLNYEYTMEAMNRACHLLEKYANAKVLKDIIIHDILDKTVKTVTFSSNQINSLLGIEINESDMEKELDRLGFSYNLSNNLFTVTIPNRRLDIDPNINDIAEEIGRLYGYHNLVSTLPIGITKEGKYMGDVKYRKIVSKFLRGLGINEAKTYTLVSKEMSKMFRYENKENIILPNPMSEDKEVIRTTILPSLINVYEYNKARKVEDILLYEISKTYDINYNEDVKVAILLSGNYISNSWNQSNIKVDFYLLKGIMENIFNYLGYKNRYELKKETINELHPKVGAKILVDKEEIGIIGAIHPTLGNYFVMEFSLTKLINKKVRSIKYKETPKYPSITKDLAFVMNDKISSEEVYNILRRVGGRLVTDISIFDVYKGPKVLPNEKSIAYSITFQDETKTLTDNEVMILFNKMIEEVTNRLGVTLRDK